MYGLFFKTTLNGFFFFYVCLEIKLNFTNELIPKHFSDSNFLLSLSLMYLDLALNNPFITTGKTWPYVSRKDDDNDIQIIEEDEDDEIGEEAEVVDNEEEPKSKTTAMTSAGASKVNVKAKFLSFHDNQRPAYFGTWSKKSSKVIIKKIYL